MLPMILRAPRSNRAPQQQLQLLLLTLLVVALRLGLRAAGNWPAQIQFRRVRTMPVTSPKEASLLAGALKRGSSRARREGAGGSTPMWA